MDIQEFYKDKEKRDLIDTITTAKWVTEAQKEAIIDILAEDWASDRAASARKASGEDPHAAGVAGAEKARKKREQEQEFKKKQAEKKAKMSQDERDWADKRAADAQAAG